MSKRPLSAKVQRDRLKRSANITKEVEAWHARILALLETGKHVLEICRIVGSVESILDRVRKDPVLRATMHRRGEPKRNTPD